MNVNSPLTHQQLPKTKPGIEAHFLSHQFIKAELSQ